MKKWSELKGIKWDDIVFKFEYETLELPKLKKIISSASISQSHKSYIESQIEKRNDLDGEALNHIIEELEIIEDSNATNYD